MAEIHASAVVHKDVDLGEDVRIGPNCVIHSGVSIGSGTTLDANIVIEKDVTIGKNNRFFSNSVIGTLPQVLGLTEDEAGKLVIGDDNVMHEQVTIHSSMHKDGLTRVGNENFIMVGVHVGHDCQVGDKIVMSNCAQIGGHCNIGTGVWLSGVVAMHQFVTLGKWCYIAGFAGINKDVPPYLTVSGHYPPVIRGVNKRGMQRAGLSEASQERVSEAYRKLYRQGGPLLESVKALAQEDGLDENVREIVDSLLNSSKHQYGRYLETLREQ